jgi:hypothetical protein
LSHDSPREHRLGKPPGMGQSRPFSAILFSRRAQGRDDLTAGASNIANQAGRKWVSVRVKLRLVGGKSPRGALRKAYEGSAYAISSSGQDELQRFHC